MGIFATRREMARLLRRTKAAEERAARIESEAAVERARHLAREDELINRILTASGQYAIKASSAPHPAEKETPQPVIPEDSAIKDSFFEDGYSMNKSLVEVARDWKMFQETGRMPYELDDLS